MRVCACFSNRERQAIEGARINAVGAFHGRDVHKDVLTAALELDGSIALVRIER
jgi:hypothetical protein